MHYFEKNRKNSPDGGGFASTPPITSCGWGQKSPVA